jgi:long-chain fatty acid transport protein
MNACRSLIVSTLLCAAFSAQAGAAGFALQEQSVRNQGAAFAGAGANPEDASTIFYNPAGMTALGGPQAAGGVSIIMPRGQYADRNSTAGLNAGAQAAYTGGNGGNPFPAKGLPNLYAAAPIRDGKTWIGIGITVPFGLGNEYDRGSFTRYDSLSSTLTVVDVAPVVAYKITDSLSIGGGPDLQVVTAQLDGALPCPSPAFGCGAAFSPATDGLSRLSGMSWHVGYNLGAQWQATDGLRFGAQYRAAQTHNMKGTVVVAGLTGALAASNGSRDAAAELKLPPSAGVSAAYDATKRLKLLGSANWTGWSSFDAIRVTFNLPLADATTPENYRDTWMAALGAEWKQDDRWTFRGGMQYDQTPTTTPDRSTRTPDGDRTWLSAGASYAFGPLLRVDAAYSHLFVRDASLALTKLFYAGTAAASTVHVNGAMRSSVDIVSLQAAIKF